MKNLQGANAIVTGGSRGIGPYIARALAKEGVNIALAARDAARLQPVRDEIAKLGVKTLSIPTDLRLAEDRARLIDSATSEFGQIDILVNNAGVEPTGEFSKLDEDTIQDAIMTNFTSGTLLMRALLPGMIERRRGHIVNIASAAGKIPIPYDSVYSATKFALVGLSHAVRQELRDSGVGVSVICPGFISEVGMYADVQQEAQVTAPAIAGTSKPEQVANAVVRSIRKNVAEVIVTPITGRPLMAIAGVSPGAGQVMMRLTGVVSLFRQVAEKRSQGT